ncbi:unnamed protein product [Closterium sp. NIES-53]
MHTPVPSWIGLFTLLSAALPAADAAAAVIGVTSWRWRPRKAASASPPLPVRLPASPPQRRASRRFLYAHDIPPSPSLSHSSLHSPFPLCVPLPLPFHPTFPPFLLPTSLPLPSTCPSASPSSTPSTSPSPSRSPFPSPSLPHPPPRFPSPPHFSPLNLAVALSRHMRLQVGLLDADVFGPSLPKLLGLATAGRPQLASPSPNARMLPLQAHGVLCMSMGFLMPADVAAVWRGPMVMAAVEKLVRGTEWGRLDVLVVDMPPGTGDVQLSMSQRVRLSGVEVQVWRCRCGGAGVEMQVWKVQVWRCRCGGAGVEVQVWRCRCGGAGGEVRVVNSLHLLASLHPLTLPFLLPSTHPPHQGRWWCRHRRT